MTADTIRTTIYIMHTEITRTLNGRMATSLNQVDNNNNKPNRKKQKKIQSPGGYGLCSNANSHSNYLYFVEASAPSISTSKHTTIEMIASHRIALFTITIDILELDKYNVRTV